MKKLLFLAFAIASIINLQAQNRLGVKTGFTSNFIIEQSNGQTTTTDNLFGLTTGLTGEHKLRRNVSTFFELLYIQKGGQ